MGMARPGQDGSFGHRYDSQPRSCDRSVIPYMAFSRLSLTMLLDAVPIIGIDIWEHAFYIQYKNVKPDVCPYIITNRYIIDV
jgi:superoxide dismutase